MHPKIRIISALPMLGYGMSYDRQEEICHKSSSSAAQSLDAFAVEMIECFGAEYLRRTTENDPRLIVAINPAHGFPGYIGSWDCQHWTWEYCPIAWVGYFKGKQKKTTVVFEAMADGELWIWCTFFRSAGSLNDINVLDQSTIVQDILNGKMLPVFEFEIDGRRRNLPYYLVDDIYPQWAIFVKTMAEAMLQKHRRFSNAQETFRKDVERAVGVLVS